MPWNGHVSRPLSPPSECFTFYKPSGAGCVLMEQVVAINTQPDNKPRIVVVRVVLLGIWVAALLAGLAQKLLSLDENVGVGARVSFASLDIR
jgi:hypothetical protein